MTSHPISRILELILIAGVFLYAVEVANAGVVSTVADEQREFDSFILVVVWAPTFCARKTTCCKQNACCRGENNTAIFTLRGLWPDYEDGTWPKCCSGPPFDENEISPYLQGDMEKYWPSLQCEMFSTCNRKGRFYAHEWETHGTCAASVTGDQYNYFLTALGLYYTFDVTEVLFGAGYVPSNSEKYPTAGIVSALENAFQGRPQMTCSKTGALEDVRLCLTKKFKFRDCPGKLKCPDYVSLPEPDVTRIARLSSFGHESS